MFPSALPIRHFLNPRANPSLAYGPEQARILNRRAHQAAFEERSSWDGYAATPLLNLEGMAGRLGIESVVSDTTYPGYEEVPRHIMQGYTVLVRECLAAGMPSPRHGRSWEKTAEFSSSGPRDPPKKENS